MMLGMDYLLEEAATDRLVDDAALRAPLVALGEADDIPINEAVLTCERVAAQWHRDMADLEAMG